MRVAGGTSAFPRGVSLRTPRAPPADPAQEPSSPSSPSSCGVAPLPQDQPLHDSHDSIYSPCPAWALHLTLQALLAAVHPRDVGRGDACLGDSGAQPPILPQAWFNRRERCQGARAVGVRPFAGTLK